MKRVVYYFSGTGNSLYTANQLASQLDAELISIVHAINNNVAIKADSTGLVYPTYMYRPPRLVADFISSLPPSPYLYAVVTNGGDAGDVLSRTNALLKPKNMHLNAEFTVELPDNYTPFGGPPETSKQEELFAAANEKIRHIAQIVQNKESHVEKNPSWFKTKIHPGIWYGIGYWSIPTYDSKFWLNENCVGCKSCMKVCPVNNITIPEKTPKWNGNCQQCLACLQWCKKEAIELHTKTKGVTRYHHPNIKRRQIISQKD